MLKDKRVLITGGTGSLGTHLVKRLLKIGICKDITVFSRDEAKQHDMRQKFRGIKYIIGDVRNRESITNAVHKADIVFHTAALKQVGACETNPWEAVLTNVYGVHNIIEAAKSGKTETVIGVSSDKGCQPINIYGATKFLQERMLVQANIDADCRFISALYGNVMGSRGSVIPLFQQQIENGGPVTITSPYMTRFLISLDLAVDTLLAALESALPGEVYIPYGLPAATIGDIATVLIGDRCVEKKIIGVKQGEKHDEILVSGHEANRTLIRDGYCVLSPQVQELPVLIAEYNSRDHLISASKLKAIFEKEGLV